MTLSYISAHIHNLTDHEVTFVINSSNSITMSTGSAIITTVTAVSLGDTTVYAIEPQPTRIEVNGDITRMEYR